MKPEWIGVPCRSLVAILCTIALAPGDTLVYAQQQASPPATSSGGQAATIPAEQLDSLVAPIALYPDPLLAQVLAASTYPLEIIKLQRWLAQNSSLKDKQLAGCGGEAALGPECAGTGGSARSGQAAGRRYWVDRGSGQRFSGAASRCDGRRSADAQEGPGKRHSENHRTAEGGNHGGGEQECNRHRTGQSAGCVRAFVQSGGGVGCAVSIRILRFTIRRWAIMPRAWRSHSAWA